MRLTAAVLILIIFFSCDAFPTGNAENTGGIENDAGVPVPEEPEEKPLDKNMACLLAQMAYCSNPQEKLDSFLPGWTIRWYPSVVNSNHAWVASNGRQWAVAFRGSLMEISWHAFDNWINQDLNIVTQVKWPYNEAAGARISQGAQNSLTNLLALRDSSTGLSLTDFLVQQLPGSSPVLFAGHSLGGTLATVYAPYFAHQWSLQKKDVVPNIRLVSFASPAPGNDVFANTYNRLFPATTRVESGGDIVARFPCISRIDEFAANCAPLPPADQIEVSYQGMSVTLQRALQVASLSLSLLEMKNGGSYQQVGGTAEIVSIPIKGKYTGSPSVEDWFFEAGYQHGIAQYAEALKIPLINCR